MDCHGVVLRKWIPDCKTNVYISEFVESRRLRKHHSPPINWLSPCNVQVSQSTRSYPVSTSPARARCRHVTNQRGRSDASETTAAIYLFFPSHLSPSPSYIRHRNLDTGTRSKQALLPPPSHYGTCLGRRFYRDKSAALYSLVDSR